MDFELTDSQNEIVAGVRALCQRFPDEYCAAKIRVASSPMSSIRRWLRLATWVSPFPRIRRQRTRYHRGCADNARGRLRGGDERSQLDPFGHSSA